MGRVMSGSGYVGLLVKIRGLRPTRHTVGSGSGFLVVIFGFGQVFSWFGWKFSLRLTRHTVGSGQYFQVGRFRAAHDEA